MSSEITITQTTATITEKSCYMIFVCGVCSTIFKCTLLLGDNS